MKCLTDCACNIRNDCMRDTVSLLCQVAHVSRSAYYRWIAAKKDPCQDNRELKEILRFEQARLHGI